MPAVVPPQEAPIRSALVLLAAGEGRRVGGPTSKVLLPLAGRRVIAHSLRRAGSLPGITGVVVVVREADREDVEATVRGELSGVPLTLVAGGPSRHESEWHALRALEPAIRKGETDVVVIHDAARPLAGAAMFAAVIAGAYDQGGALPVCEQPGLVPLGDAPPERRRTVAVQTPQAFRAEPLLDAYTAAAEEGFVGTDTASCVERYTDLDVRCVPGRATNVKITFPEDLALAERLLANARPRC